MHYNGHIASWLHAIRNLHVDLHQTGDKSWRATLILNHSRYSADGDTYRQNRMSGSRSAQSAIHTARRGLAFARDVQREVTANGDWISRCINSSVNGIDRRRLSPAALGKCEDAGRRCSYGKREGVRGLALVGNRDLCSGARSRIRYNRRDLSGRRVENGRRGSVERDNGSANLRTEYSVLRLIRDQFRRIPEASAP